jgi:hypothetical protein
MHVSNKAMALMFLSYLHTKFHCTYVHVCTHLEDLVLVYRILACSGATTDGLEMNRKKEKRSTQ